MMKWQNILEAMGIDVVRWRWRMRRWRNRFDDWTDHARQKGRTVTYENKFCPACGALVDRDEKTCPHCQWRLPSWRTQVAKRSLGLVVPHQATASTLLLIANIATLLLALLLFGGGELFKPSSEMLVRMGALIPRAVQQHGEYWRVITYGYLHIGLIHILFNMIILSQIGPVLEDRIGTPRFFVTYTLALLGGAVADLYMRAGTVTVIAGASGALFGLIGFGISYGHFYGGPSGQAERNFFVRWALYGFIFGMIVGADNIAHFGGLVAGLILGYLVERERANADSFTPAWTAAAYLCLAATAAAFVWMWLGSYAGR